MVKIKACRFSKYIINTQLISIHGIAIMRAVRYQRVSVFRCIYFWKKKKMVLNPPHYLNEDEAHKIFQHAKKKKRREEKESREIKYSNQNVCEYIKWNLMKMSFWSARRGRKQINVLVFFLFFPHDTHKKEDDPQKAMSNVRIHTK